jgi:O-antigen ligase
VATLAGLYLVLKITLLGLYLSQRYSLDENLELLVGVLVLACLFSFFALWQMPSQSIHPGGEWKGIFTWKNYLGRLMALGNVLLVVYWFWNPVLWKRIVIVGLFIASSVLLVFSRSTTSLLAMVGLYGIVGLYGAWLRWGMRLRARAYWLLAALGGAMTILAVVNRDGVLALFDKNATLTGRTTLWEILWQRFQERPVLGFGYEAFWKQYPQGIMPPGWVEGDGFATHAHNGYIEIVLALGLIGLILYLFALGLSWSNALKLMRQKKQIPFIWPLLVLIYLSWANLTYSIAFSFPDFHWGVFVLSAGVVLKALEPAQSADDSISPRSPSSPAQPGV